MLNDNSHMLPCCHLAPTAAPPDCGEDSSHGKARPPLLAGEDDQMPSDKRNRSRRHSDTKDVSRTLNLFLMNSDAVGIPLWSRRPFPNIREPQEEHGGRGCRRPGEMHCGKPSCLLRISDRNCRGIFCCSGSISISSQSRRDYLRQPGANR